MPKSNLKQGGKKIYRPRSWGRKKRDAYNKGFIAGQDSVRECVPIVLKYMEKNEDNLETNMFISGFNACREQILSNISNLQDKSKEV